MTILLGPVRCQACRQLVWWARPHIDFYGVARLGRAAWFGADGTEHRCEVEP